MKARYIVHSCSPTRLVREVDLGKGTIAQAAYDGWVVELLPTDHPESGTIKLAIETAGRAWVESISEGSTIEVSFRRVEG